MPGFSMILDGFECKCQDEEVIDAWRLEDAESQRTAGPGKTSVICATAAEILFVFRLVVLLLSFPFNLFLPKFVIIRHALLLVQSRLPRTTSDAICRYLLIGTCADPIQTDRRTPCVLEKGPQRGDDAVWWCLAMFVVVVVVLSSLSSSSWWLLLLLWWWWFCFVLFGFVWFVCFSACLLVS